MKERVRDRYRFVQQTLMLPVGQYIFHVENCQANVTAGACGGTYACNACNRTVGQCNSRSDMPAVCLDCRHRFHTAWLTYR